MKKILLSLVAILLLAITVIAYDLTRDGVLKTPTGQGMLTLEGEAFEAFPLPRFAASFISEDYKSYLVEVEPGIKVHILEVGSGYPVYLQHGMPTSGFLNRRVAEHLPRDRFRIIMPTIIGLGFSSKVPASQHTLDNHIRWMNTALAKMALTELIFVGHDWGGPIGMGALARSPSLMEGAVLLNTVLNAPAESKKLSTPLRLANTPIIGELIFEGAISVFDVLPTMQADPSSISLDLVELYKRPVESSGNSKAVLAMMRMSADGPEHPSSEQLREIERYLEGSKLPVEIAWGMNDSILGPRLAVMEAIFPDARVTKTEAGHFLQEETPKAIAEAVLRIYERIHIGEGN